MAEQSRFVANSIEELLVALADGFREAQAALNDTPLLDAAGRPIASYALPFLDFTIAVEMTTSETQRGLGRLALIVGKSVGESQSAVRSTVSGKLVATPPGEGLPVPRLDVTVGAMRDREVPITVRASNSAGELLPDQAIELNIDDDASARLSGPGFRRDPAVRLAAALLRTGADGIATTRLLVPNDPPGPGMVLVVTAGIGAFAAQAAIPLDPVS